MTATIMQLFVNDKVTLTLINLVIVKVGCLM